MQRLDQDHDTNEPSNPDRVRHELRQTVEELTRYREHLEEMVQERTVGLKNANEALQAEINKRKQANATQRETEQKLRNIIENSTNLFYMHGTDHVFTYMSPQSRHFFDCEPEEAMGCWMELITDNPVNRIAIEATQRAIDTGERQPPYMVECIGRMGRIIWVEVNESPIVEDGRTVAIVGSLTDITERRRAEEALRESEQRFASFMLHMPAAAWMKDMQGRFVYANAETERVFSTPLTALVGKTDYDFFTPEIARQFSENDCLVLSDGGNLQTTEVLRQADGTEHHSLVSKFVVAGPDGKPAYVAGVAFDITERKRAEQALQESEERLRLAIDSTGLGTFDYYPQTGTMIWSERTKLHFGLPPDAQVDYGVFLAGLHPDDRERVDGIVQHLLRSECSGEYITEYRTIGLQDGKERWITARGRMLYDETGRAVRFVGTTLDISERKQAEEKIEELDTNLAERAAELALANQELETFNYTVAHDLRNPLNVISSYCQVIMELCGNQLDVHCKQYLQEAYNGTLRMNRLIGDLLNFSRLAHVEPSREPVNLSAMAHLVAAELKSAESERRVSFRIADGLTANADANMLRVVLSNLLGNAWKYTGKREEAVIEFDATEIDGKPAWFVRDNGKGFDMADADKLFAPFQRLPGAEKFRGFGIGLATVERIIRRHGGRVWAEGEPDKGATFWFTLSADT